MDASIIEEIESSYASHPGYRHAFWEWMMLGSFDQEVLKQFALLYYEHVKVFRLYLAGLMTIIPKEEMQIALAKLLADEYGIAVHGHGNEPSHPEMFRSFMRSIGLTESEWNKNHLIEGIEYYRRVHFSLFRGGLTDEAIGAVIFGMERTTPYRHGKVLKGLKIYDERNGTSTDKVFFSAHVMIDPGHNESLIDVAEEWFTRPQKVERLKLGARISFDARKIFLDDLATALNLPIK
jgi:pyrroloquinoline-quinone synthase